MNFEPDYRHFETVMKNARPARLPVYEHTISDVFMEDVLGVRFAELLGGEKSDMGEYFRQYCRFFREMTYDTVSFEFCISHTLPGRMALKGGQGPIQSRADFEAYPWEELPSQYCGLCRSFVRSSDYSARRTLAWRLLLFYAWITSFSTPVPPFLG